MAQDACGACATGHGEAVDGRVALYAGRRTCDRADCRPPRQDAVSWRVVEKRDSCLRFSSRLTRRVRARCPGHNETALGRPTVAATAAGLRPGCDPAYVRAATGLRPRCDRTTSALRPDYVRAAPRPHPRRARADTPGATSALHRTAWRPLPLTPWSASRLRPKRSWLLTHVSARTAEVSEISPASTVPAQISASLCALPLP